MKRRVSTFALVFGDLRSTTVFGRERCGSTIKLQYMGVRCAGNGRQCLRYIG